MPEIADAHYALVLRELARFANIYGATLQVPAAGNSTFQLTGIGGTRPSCSYLEQFERLTGGGHLDWQSPSFSKLTSSPQAIARCLKGERGIVRNINRFRWKWHHLQLREEALMWLGLMRLRVARERWWDRASGELVLIEEPGRSFSDPLLIGEQARAIQEFLRVFASLSATVELGNALSADERTRGRRALAATDEWAHANSCEITVKVLGEIAVSPSSAAVSPEEMINDD